MPLEATAVYGYSRPAFFHRHDALVGDAGGQRRPGQVGGSGAQAAPLVPLASPGVQLGVDVAVGEGRFHLGVEVGLDGPPAGAWNAWPSGRGPGFWVAVRRERIVLCGHGGAQQRRGPAADRVELAGVVHRIDLHVVVAELRPGWIRRSTRCQGRTSRQVACWQER